MGILDSSNIPTDGRKVVRVRCDRIGSAGGRELWWVALAFADDTTSRRACSARSPRRASSPMRLQPSGVWG